MKGEETMINKLRMKTGVLILKGSLKLYRFCLNHMNEMNALDLIEYRQEGFEKYNDGSEVFKYWSDQYWYAERDRMMEMIEKWKTGDFSG